MPREGHESEPSAQRARLNTREFKEVEYDSDGVPQMVFEDRLIERPAENDGTVLVLAPPVPELPTPSVLSICNVPAPPTQSTPDLSDKEQSGPLQEEWVAMMAAPPAALPVQLTLPVAEPGLRWWPQGPENNTFHTQKLKLRLPLGMIWV